uniref:splicing regulator SDE2 isoform X2 n=1 Tax=Centroberyx gerrardi TaxID=166262 RepID=UPI003AAB79E6
MEVFVSGPFSRFSSSSFPAGSCVRDILDRFLNQKGVPAQDFYVSSNGRRSDLQDPVQHGAVYHLEPRLCGGKGGFGSMLRALGAQIEKTTNREACRDLSGRRLRDVNHEKEMAEWLKKQAEREAEKEQRRLERLQRKLAEPKHQFTDTDYQQQCHDLSERLEDSVLKGKYWETSGGGQVKVKVKAEEGRAKRPSPDKSKRSAKRKCFWTGDLDGPASSEEEEEGEDEEREESPSSSASGGSEPDEPERSRSPPASSSSSSAAEQRRDPEEEEGPEASGSAPQQPEPVRPVDLQAAGSVQKPVRPVDLQAAGSVQKPVRPVDLQAAGSVQKPVRPVDLQAAGSVQEPVRPVDLQAAGSVQKPVRPVDLQAAGSAEELEELGLENLKVELMSRGLKCGGTLTERAARLFSVKGLKPEQIDPVLLAKPGKAKKK